MIYCSAASNDTGIEVFCPIRDFPLDHCAPSEGRRLSRARCGDYFRAEIDFPHAAGCLTSLTDTAVFMASDTILSSYPCKDILWWRFDFSSGKNRIDADGFAKIMSWQYLKTLICLIKYAFTVFIRDVNSERFP